MSILKVINTFALFLCAMTIVSVRADSLEGAELEAYDASCPAGNYRAVWAEPLTGIMEAWVALVCLNEDEQETSYWYVTPEGHVVSQDEAELPVYVRPMAEAEVVDSIDALGDDDTIDLLLDFKYEQPDVPPIEDFGYPAGSFGSSGSGATGDSATGGIGSSYVVYYLNGQEVSAAEYEEWQAIHLAASRARNAEIDRLILEQVHLSLYDLVERNQWHDWVDVDAVNSGVIDSPRWEYKASLLITLSGEQARRLLHTSEELVYVSQYYEPVFTDGDVTSDTSESGGFENGEALLDGDDLPLSASVVSTSSGGALNPLVALMMTFCFFRCSALRGFFADAY